MSTASPSRGGPPRPTPGELMASCDCTSTPLLRAGRVVCASCGAPVLGGSAPPRLWSQYDLPPGCKTSSKFLKAWRRAAAEGDEGATQDGRARLLTPDAYLRHTRRAKAATAAPTVEDVDVRVLRFLGLERVP